MKEKFDENWPLLEEYLVELGRIFSLWGSLEANLNIAITKLLGYDEILDWRGLIVTAHSNFKQRLDVFSSLCEELHKDYPHLSDYLTVLKTLEKASRARNKYAHNGMHFDPSENAVVLPSASARGRLKTKGHL